MPGVIQAASLTEIQGTRIRCVSIRQAAPRHARAKAQLLSKSPFLFTSYQISEGTQATQTLHCSRRFTTPLRRHHGLCLTAMSKDVDAPLASKSVAIPELKASLLRLLSTLDRGAAATPEERNKVEVAASALEGAYLEELRAAPPPPLEGLLEGTWKLVYSSTFAGQTGGTQGFAGTPTGSSPLQLGQVFQRVDVSTMTLDNIVEIRTPSLPFLPEATATLTLAHSLAVMGPSTVRITFESTTVDVDGGGIDNLAPFTLPQLPKELQLPPVLRSGAFDTTYADDEMRVSRGDRGELRVFIK
ncbi:plastid-lipid-associated protein [Cymbomonas tetramitiformis]|uniref:Plastid-lipid-associated protein n=1 Tax=Cymbomonas tetramitiformis TaxID=36881 RepID=A0AAE0GYN5_9CHLO|nr:plastid-lipid-associated protein [Cymbomonas tetramitiformis]